MRIWGNFAGRWLLPCLAIPALAIATPALAHHVADGKTPTTLMQGLLSGLAHPILELDHLVFILAIALVSTFVEHGSRIAAVFVGALLLGVIGHVVRGNLPLLEILVAASIVIAGLALVARRLGDPRLWMGFAAIAGLIHGTALGGTITTAPARIIASYVLGLAVCQVLLIVPSQAIAELAFGQDRAGGLKLQAAGGAVAAVGVFFLASALFAG